MRQHYAREAAALVAAERKKTDEWLQRREEGLRVERRALARWAADLEVRESNLSVQAAVEASCRVEAWRAAISDDGGSAASTHTPLWSFPTSSSHSSAASHTPASSPKAAASSPLLSARPTDRARWHSLTDVTRLQRSNRGAPRDIFLQQQVQQERDDEIVRLNKEYWQEVERTREREAKEQRRRQQEADLQALNRSRHPAAETPDRPTPRPYLGEEARKERKEWRTRGAEIAQQRRQQQLLQQEQLLQRQQHPEDVELVAAPSLLEPVTTAALHSTCAHVVAGLLPILVRAHPGLLFLLF